MHTQILVECKLSIIFLNFVYLIYISGYACQDEAQIKYVINHDLHELGDWSKRWLMSFNPDKTESMLFKNVENSTIFIFILM
jgi:hypothetical protein